MKNKFIFIFLFLLFGLAKISAQGTNCLGSQPFCSDQSYTFPASTNTTSQNGPNYGCLSMQPNPAWYHMQVQTSGNIEITLTNSQNEDIDFVCWGPFSSPTAACTGQLTNTGGFFGCWNYPCGNTVDCSYDAQATEIVNIPNAQAGKYYILLITNYSGNPTNISAQQTGGTGSTDCSIVEPCTITSVTSTISACNATNNQYTVNGTVSFTDPPTTGQLIIRDCSGTQLTYNAPFGTSQAYNFTGLTSNGAACTINAFFSDETTCSKTVNYTAPAACVCNANAGTSTVTINGQSTNNYVLCDGDAITIQSNNDNLPPLDKGIINGAGFSPGLGYAVYTCPPTPNMAPLSDPCFSGFFTGTLSSFSDVNNGGTSTLLTSLAANGVTVTNSTVYIAPVTLYNATNQTYDAACYKVGTPIKISYLQPIVSTVLESCINTNAVVTLSGSYPSFNASNFTLINVTPSNITLSSTTVSDAGTTTLTGFNPGDLYAFDITDNNGCTANFSAGPFGGLQVTNYDTTICIGGTATLTPVVTGGATPLTYSWDNGATTASITTSPAVSETNCVTITDNNGCSSGSKCFTTNLHPSLNLAISSDTTICINGQAQLTATVTGGLGSPYTYTWNNLLGNSKTHSVSPLSTTSYTVMVADGCETPIKNATVTVNVIQQPLFAFSADVTSGCPPLDVVFTSTGVPSGYSSNWGFQDGGNANAGVNINHTYHLSSCWGVVLKITSPEGCVFKDSIPNYICIDQPPLVDFIYTPEKPTTFSPVVEFINSTTGGNTYEWIIKEEDNVYHYTTENSSHKFPTDRGNTYEACLVSSNLNNCADTTCKSIIVLEDIIIYLPNTFTPNGDLLNDVLIPSIIGVKKDAYTYQVFNRWGKLIFETDDVTKGWDGYENNKVAKTDVYIWKITAVDNIRNKEHNFKGHVNLIK